MGANDLKKLLEETADKLSVFTNINLFDEYECTRKELYDLIREFFNDEEILKLFSYPALKDCTPGVKEGILKLISDENVLLQALRNDDIMDAIENWQVFEIIIKSSENVKFQLLHDEGFIERSQLKDYQIQKILLSLNPQKIAQILEERTLVIEKFKLSNWQISDLIKKLLDEDEKIKFSKMYNMDNYLMVDIASGFSTAKKIDFILTSDFNKYDTIKLMRLLEPEDLIKFLNGNKQFWMEHDIAPYEIVDGLDTEKQQKLAEQIQTMDLELYEKKEIIAVLDKKVKQTLELADFPEELKKVLQITSKNKRVSIDLNGDLEQYRGLDRLMSINGMEFTEEERKKLIKLCNICPNMEVISILNSTAGFLSTGKEYVEAEQWISSVLDSLKPEYSQAQKLAIIDNAIGRRVSYSPDFETEVYDSKDSRALWKIVSTGYGVCNGIANLEKYMLERVGIESEMASSGSHVFLIIKDIELPLASGEKVRGDTIVDPTWNLAEQRFGGKPSCFCINYEQARKKDIDGEGKDRKSHKNDEQLSDITLSLDDKSLRALFTSVGLADREGKFPIKELVAESNSIDVNYANNPNENIRRQLALLKKFCPEFTRCQNSSISVLKDILLNGENLPFNKCAVNRVYNRADKDRRPVIYVYIDSNELGRKFYFADKENGEFIEMPEENFKNQFECYDMDLKASKGIRPWENSSKTKENTDLSTSSEKLIAEEGR